MPAREMLDVDPAALHLPGSRRDGDMTRQERTRSDLLNELAELGRLRPDWRLGQMLANLATTAGRLDPGGVWDLEDDEALTAARELVAQCSHDKRVPV